MDRTLLKTLSLSILLIIATLLVYPYYKDSSRGPVAEWHMINVNVDGQQGDANLLVIGDQVVMIDAGQKSIAYSSVVPYLEKFGVEKIDHFFISHPHDAYYGGLISILDSGIPVTRIYHAGNAMQTISSPRHRLWYRDSIKFARSKGTEVIKVEQGFSLDVPSDGRFEVIYTGTSNSNQNPALDSSGTLIIKFLIAGSSVLFGADIGEALAMDLIGQPGIEAEFLKMPHPGEVDVAPVSFFESVNPDFVLVPGPKRRWCGDAGRLAREWTIKKRIPTWVTGSNGHIRVIWRPGEVLVAPQRVDDRCKLKAFGSIRARR
jgi:beta-lactamase superfamily II metal-dependent hydrolase